MINSGYLIYDKFLPVLSLDNEAFKSGNNTMLITIDVGNVIIIRVVLL